MHGATLNITPTLREWLKQQRIYSGEFGALTEAEGRWLLGAKTLDAAGDRLAAQRRQGDGGGIAGLLRPSAPTAGPSVDFATANSASEYVAANGTPPAKVAAARADIERILGVVQDDQLDFVSYTRGGRLVLGKDSTVTGLSTGSGTGVPGAAEALKAPNQPAVVRAAYGIDPADPSNTGSERISSIIPALIADPKRSWDIRGAQIATDREVIKPPLNVITKCKVCPLLGPPAWPPLLAPPCGHDLPKPRRVRRILRVNT